MNGHMTENGVGNSSSLLRLSGWGKFNSALRGLVLVAATLLIFFLLFRRIDLSSTMHLLRDVPFSVWVLASVLTMSFPVLSAVRWHFVLRTMGYSVSIPRCLLIIIGIWPLSSISPSKSGDFLKALSLRHHIRPAVIAGSVLTERVLDVLVLSVFALLGGLIFRDFRIAVVAAFVTTGVLCSLLAVRLEIKLPVGPKLQSTLKDLLHSLRLLGTQPGTLSIIILLTVSNWFASIIQAKILFGGVGASVPLGFTATALPIAIFAGLLPITFGGMATRDSAMVVLFAGFASGSQSLAVGLLYSFFGYWLIAVIGIPFVRKALNL